MEGTPFVVENNNEDDQEKRRKEERASKAEKPEVFGMLAVESPAEDEPTPFEKAWESTRKPDAETEEQPPEPEAKAEMPIERVPEEQARVIVQEMVAPKQEEEAEAEQPEVPETPEAPEVTETETEPEAEIEPEPETESEPEPKAEEEPAEIPETPPVEAPEPEPVVMAEIEPTEFPETVEDKTEPEPAEKLETPPDEDDKKPGIISSLFRRGDRKKKEKEPEPDIEEAPEEAPEQETAAVEDAPDKAEPEEPKFEFKEKTEEIIEKPQAEEAPEEPETEHRKPEAKPEHIGQMLLNTEASVEQHSKPVNEVAASSQEAEKKLHVEASPIEPVSGKRVDTLSRPELMQLSEKIEINGNNLRHIYETHLIGERGLRRLIAEYVRGGDLQKALRREVMEHEMDFERDPVMRNLKPVDASPIDGNSAVLEKLLEQADVSLADVNNPTVSFKTPGQQKRVRERLRAHRYRSLDIILVASISTLSLLIILVLLIKG